MECCREAFYAPAEIGDGHTVADFGCGPGHTAIEFARRVGPSGHVHALDINAEFVRRARARSQRAGFADRVTVHLLHDEFLPLADCAFDRITARNTIIYVRDPLTTFKEFRRVSRTTASLMQSKATGFDGAENALPGVL